jgi:hypothetical protein
MNLVKCDVGYVAAFCLESRCGRFIFAAVFYFIRGNKLMACFDANHFSDDQSGAAQQNQCGEEDGNGNMEELFHWGKVTMDWEGMQGVGKMWPQIWQIFTDWF